MGGAVRDFFAPDFGDCLSDFGGDGGGGDRGSFASDEFFDEMENAGDVGVLGTAGARRRGCGFAAWRDGHTSGVLWGRRDSKAKGWTSRSLDCARDDKCIARGDKW